MGDSKRDMPLNSGSYLHTGISHVITEPECGDAGKSCAFQGSNHVSRCMHGRWLTLKRDPSGYTPFGSGPHICLGMTLAIAELRAATAMLGRDGRRWEQVQCSPSLKLLDGVACPAWV